MNSFIFALLSNTLAETLAETCFCQDGLNRIKLRFKPPLAETCQPWNQQIKTSAKLKQGEMQLSGVAFFAASQKWLSA